MADGGSWWLAAVEGVKVQQGDLVVLLVPKNWDEPIITGVLASANCRSGSEYPEYQASDPQKTVVLRDSDDMIRVTTSDGRPLVEVGRNLHGPVIRLSGRDAQIDIPGHLRIAAGRLDLESRNDDIQIKSDKEVVVQGDMIRLN